jgi:anti-sigma B factor antagonist
MLIEIERQDDVCILHLKGRFASGMDPDYLRAKADEFKRQNPKKVLVDLREVPAIGSTGIGFIVGIYTSTVNGDGRFVLVGSNRRVSEVFNLTRLDTVLPMASDMESGLASLRAVRSAGKN